MYFLRLQILKRLKIENLAKRTLKSGFAYKIFLTQKSELVSPLLFLTPEIICLKLCNHLKYFIII